MLDIIENQVEELMAKIRSLVAEIEQLQKRVVELEKQKERYESYIGV